ncbi:DUF6248 family natural product biosynthesis protein [Streptomyces sp. NBC_01264]|uniref:DUF6248 family natural product biosynthesis protein n=1 Tax=Streptomyces sp. NBC_01264 TaxID=2903804 RepID=UPI0022537CBF|nr:DUF6248 family natural product biosynthesis protein [Streptomyces sp. NBC_01264]MCX4784059.1 DUF6248 family natural product biosynthesis protein [Streptomyces sp. NBC_01264]
MSENSVTAGRRTLPAQVYVEAAARAAGLAVAAADTAMHAVSRAVAREASQLEVAMHAAHHEAQEAERFARWAGEWEADGISVATLANYAARAVDAAVRAQAAAGTETTAAPLRAELERPLTEQERAEKERAARREKACEEDEARAATGMDADNRNQTFMNRHFAEQYVSELGWTAGHVRVMESAATGRLYWRNGQARQAPKQDVLDGGRRLSRVRTRALHAARFLTAVRRESGARLLILSPQGRVALELARLYPQGLYADDRSAYEARYARCARSWMSSDGKKDAARHLPPLDLSALRAYRRPVTLAEQEARAQTEADGRWEDDGGPCPGVPTPRPASIVPGPDSADGFLVDPAPAAATAELPDARVPEAERTLPRPRPRARADAGQRDRSAVSPSVIRRPQRTLTAEEKRRVWDMALLNLHGALIMGITDPVPNPSAMTEEEGAWVREHAWPGYFHEIERKYAFGFARWAMCERGTCWNCLAGRCDRCVHRQRGGPHVDNNTDWVHGLRGRCVAKVIVRPGGEPCVWWCRCPCSKNAAAPAAQPSAGPVREPDDAAGLAPAPEAALDADAPKARERQQALF